MNNMPRTERKWLIRSLEHVLGPYSTEEVEQLLREGSLSLSDEVVGPCSFWSPFLGHPDFDDFARSINIRTRITSAITQFTEKINSIGGKTFTDNDIDTQSKTQTLTERNFGVKDSFSEKGAKDANFEVVASKKAEKPKAVRYYSKDTSQKVAQKKVDHFIPLAWRGVVVCAFVLVSYISYMEFFQPFSANKNVLEQIRTKGMKLYKAGNHEEAFEYFKKGMDSDLLNTEEKIIVSSLLIQKNKTERANRILDSIGESDSRIDLLRGLLDLSAEKWKGAEENFLKSKEVEFYSGLLNLGILKFVRKDYVSSLDYVDQLSRENYGRGILTYLKALNVVGLGDKDAISYLQSLIKETQEYHQEIYLLIASLYSEQRNKEMIQVYIQKSLNEDPFFNKEYNYSSFTAREYLGWKQLLDRCKIVYDYDPNHFLNNLIYGFCYLKAGIVHKGIPYIETAKRQAGNNPLVRSVYAYYLIQNGSFSEAKTNLELAINQGHTEWPLPHILQAYLHEETGKWSLALKSWEHVLWMEHSHLSGMAGMAFNNYKMHNKVEMTANRDRALEIYPYYSRLILLQD